MTFHFFKCFVLLTFAFVTGLLFWAVVATMVLYALGQLYES